MAPTPTTSAATGVSAAAPTSTAPRDPSKDALIIFDTTLRDGEQSPGVTLTADEKVEIATALSALGVDVCEAGFPIASEGDFEAVKRIACEVGPLLAGRPSGKPMVIAGLARAVPADIQRAYDAVKHAPLHRIHTFLATSDIHLQYKLKISREECIQRAVAAVAFARSLGCIDIEFSPEDAGRSDRDFLCSVLGKVIEAGATTLNIPDTVGYNTPEEYGKMIKYLVANTPGGDKVIWSTHCHNDLGLATANTLSGVLNGARQVEVTINGIGERAGNTSLEEIVMAIHTHPNYFPVYSNINTRQIYSTSQLVTKKTGMVIQPNKAIVGANAFAHESGIHQDGVLKHKATYEIIQPEIIGLTSGTLVLGKHSGRNAFRSRIEELLGEHNTHTQYLRNNPTSFDALFTKFKKIADSKRSGFTDQDILALVDDHFNLIVSGAETYKLRAVQVVSGSNMLSTATVTIIDTTRSRPIKRIKRQGSLSPPGSPAMSGLQEDEETGLELTDAAIGQGPIHAIFSAINRLIGIKNVLASYEVRSVTSGSDALGKVLVRISPVDENDEIDADDTRPKIDDSTSELDTAPKTARRKETFLGQGVDEDILVSSAKAYINAVNRMITFRDRRKATDAAAEVGTTGLGVSVVGGSGVVPAIPERHVNV